jgi:hypothetical protein
VDPTTRRRGETSVYETVEEMRAKHLAGTATLWRIVYEL